MQGADPEIWGWVEGVRIQHLKNALAFFFVLNSSWIRLCGKYLAVVVFGTLLCLRSYLDPQPTKALVEFMHRVLLSLEKMLTDNNEVCEIKLKYCS